MATFTLNGYNSYSGCDIIVTARLNKITGLKKELKEKVYTLGSLQTLSVSTHQDKKPVRVIGSVNALDYTMGQRTIAGSLVFAVFDQHFATEMFNDLSNATGKTFFLPDELPGLDFTVTFANEYGKTSRMAIYGIRIINEGQVMSINDLYTENTYQFVATAIEPLKKGDNSGAFGSGDNSVIIDSSTGGSNISTPTTGEEIFNKGKSLTYDDLNRTTLTAIVEQPLYNQTDGIVKFSLLPNQISGIISILDRKKDKVIKEIQVSNEHKQYNADLPEGLYAASYSNKGLTLSNTVNFNIITNLNYDNLEDDKPIIDKITSNSIRFISNNPTHNIGIVKDSNTLQIFQVELSSRIATIKGLSPNTEYLVFTSSEDSYSKHVVAKTMEENFDLVLDFKDYVQYNKRLLSKDLSEYQSILNKITDEDLIYQLNTFKTSEAKELIYMAVKYKNEYTAFINQDNLDTMPVKKINNIFGNTFSFNNGVSKANIFVSKNKKDYYESSELFPSEVNYIGKSNTIYNVVGINDNYIKSPKYCFYSFSDNDKDKIRKSFGEVDVLNSLDILKYRTSSRLSNNGLKCLAVKDYKSKDIDLLKAPLSIINDDGLLAISINFKEFVGEKNNKYYLCISNLNETLDSTPIRKSELTDLNSYYVLSSYLTAINKDDIYSIWIEDENYNMISDISFISYNTEIEDINCYLIEQEIDSIIKKIETVLNKPSYLTEVKQLINPEEMNSKDLIYMLSCLFIEKKEYDAFNLINELFKIQHQNMCVNKDKFKQVIYDNKNKTVNFNTECDIVRIAIKKDSYQIDVIKSNVAVLKEDYDYNLFYAIGDNPIIKSGFVLVSNKQCTSHLIKLEEI